MLPHAKCPCRIRHVFSSAHVPPEVRDHDSAAIVRVVTRTCLRLALWIILCSAAGALVGQDDFRAHKEHVVAEIEQLIKEGRAQDAIDLLDYCIQNSPTDGKLYILRGDAYATRYLSPDDLLRAKKEYTQAIRIKPDAMAYYRRAQVSLSLSWLMPDLNPAIDDMNRALTLDPENADYLVLRGALYYNMNRNEEAFADFEKALKLKPRHAICLNNLGVYWDTRGRKDLAISYYTQAIESQPGYAKAYENRGNLYVELGELSLALKDLDSAVRLAPTPINFFERAKIKRSLGDLQGALRDVNIALEGFTGRGRCDVLLFRAEVYKELGNAEEAKRDEAEAADLSR